MTKAQARDGFLTRRREMTAQQRDEAADAIALHLLTEPVVARARRVACYLSMPSEPGTAPLVTGLRERGVEVVVPVVVADHRLDWVAFEPSDATATTSLGVPEPHGPRHGTDALRSCGVVIVPALAVDHAGHRLGRGAGYYDRALADVDAVVCAVVFTHELVPEVPHEPHDVPVQMVVTPSGVFRVP